MLLIGLTGSIATGKSTVSTLLASPPHSIPLIDADVLARRAVEPGTRAHRRIVEHFGPSTPDLLVPLGREEEGGGGGGGGGEVGEEGGNVRRTGMGRESGKGGRAGARPLDRAVLGRRVFGDSEGKRRDRGVLNGIIHPAVRWEIYKAVLGHYVRGSWAVVLDVPLLFESGLDVICGTVIVVAVRDPEVQMQRLLERDHARGGNMTREEAHGRVQSQWDVRDKAKRCEARNESIFTGADGGRGLVIWNDADKETLGAKVAEVIKRVKRTSPCWWAWICLLVPPMAFIAGAWQILRNLVDRWAWERRKRTVKAKL